MQINSTFKVKLKSVGNRETLLDAESLMGGCGIRMMEFSISGAVKLFDNN